MTSSQRSIPTADRISDLPDSIICHILSFLPTKHAATTSILSKRWKPLWLLVLTLDLDKENFKDFKCFLKFVDLTFSLRDKTLPIHSFRFKCGKSYSLFNLPSCILKFKSFKSVEVLKFENVQIGDYNQVDFPHVKTLHLSNISFQYREYIVKFLLGFPILEDLQTELSVYCPRKKINNMNAIPKLVKVRVCDFYTPMSLVCNAKILYVEKMEWITDSTGLPMFHNLTHLELGFHATRVCYRECTWMLGLLAYFPKLQHFIIQDCVDSMNIGEHYWKDPPLSIVPECLSSHLKTCCIRGYRDIECEFEFAKYIMQHSRVLETMTIESIGLEKSEILVKLSSCIRGSRTCKLLLD